MNANSKSNSSSNFAEEENKDKHIVNLILYKHEAKKRIEELETALQKMKPSLIDSSVADMVEKTKMTHKHFSLRALVGEDGEGNVIGSADGEDEALAQISMWNNELIDVVEKLQKTLQQVEIEANEKLSTITSEMEALVYENATLVKENESLKERVADDVLRKRLANRIEVAAEKANIAAHVRTAGLRRLEYMEGTLMEAHDDMYHRQRFDAVDYPQRDCCFVFHYLSNLTYPLRGVEEVTINVCKQIMFNSQRARGGHCIGVFRGMHVFVFQDPYVALDFAQNCHTQVLQFRQQEREDLPHFSSVYEQGLLVYRGPRIHTCIYACTPEVDVDPVSGKSVYFGPEVKGAVSAAFQFSAVGEMVVNKKWAQLICRRQRYMTDSNVPVKADAMDVRDTLGKEWDVVEMPGAGGIVFSLVPTKIKGRRAVDPCTLSPSPRYPCMDIELAEGVTGIIRALKNAGDHTNTKHQHIWSAAQLSLTQDEAQESDAEDDISGPMRMLQYFTMKQEKENVTALYKDLQRAAEFYERDMMLREDRYVIASRSPLDPSETVYVCTVDFGNDAFWKSIVISTMTTQEYNSLRESIRSYIHTRGKTYFGFLMNGNDVDIFTYVFRGVESAFSFVSDVYIMVNRIGTKCSHATQGSGQDVFFLRAGITNGPMSSIYRVKTTSGSDSVKCTGAMIRLSGTLSDLAQNGEILATEDVIENFLSVNENLLDAQFNIVRQSGQYLGSNATPSAVHSILPKPFAYRRKQLLQAEKEGRRPSRCAATALEAQRTEYSRIMVEDLMVQQRERLELMESSLMAAQDRTDIFSRELRNPWFVTTLATVVPQPYGTHPNYKPPTKPLAFFYCDVVSTTALEKELPASVLQKMYGHYNYMVQSLIVQAGGLVVKTNSHSAYLVVFPRVFKALETALLLQERLLSSTWPEEMKTAEHCLFVKDAKTGDVIFNGPRVQTAVHVSTNFTWKRTTMNPGDHSGVDFTGPAMDELYYLGYNAHGGEIRFSRQCLDYLKSTSSKLLLDQLEMEMLPAMQFTNIVRRPSSSSSRKTDNGKSGRTSVLMAKSLPQVTMQAVTAVPRSIEHRLAFVLPGARRNSHRDSAASANQEPVSNSNSIVNNNNSNTNNTSTGNNTSSTSAGNNSNSAAPQNGGAGSPFSSPGLTNSTIVGTISSNILQDIPKVVPVPPVSAAQVNWYFSSEGGMKPLPQAVKGDWDHREDTASPETRKIQRTAEQLLSTFPPESASGLEPSSVVKSWTALDSPYMNFLRFSREMVASLVRAFTIINDKVKAPPLPKISLAKPKSMLPSISRGVGRSNLIPTAPSAPPPAGPKRRDRNANDVALDYLDESCKFLTKLNAMQTSPTTPAPL